MNSSMLNHVPDLLLLGTVSVAVLLCAAGLAGSLLGLTRDLAFRDEDWQQRASTGFVIGLALGTTVVGLLIIPAAAVLVPYRAAQSLGRIFSALSFAPGARAQTAFHGR
jgi:hypothetical protein